MDSQGGVLVKAYVIALHLSPVSPSESHDRRTAINFYDFPSEGGHHSLESLMAG